MWRKQTVEHTVRRLEKAVVQSGYSKLALYQYHKGCDVQN